MPATIKKILIANRGEIAVRVIRACRERGIATVAVYSEADRSALHVRLADEAYPIGPSPARESYLDGTKVLAVARRAGADAIHPGYGFLSERSDFARAVTDAGLTFIGPPADAMDAMGNKTRAREHMVRAGVPVVPGDNGEGGRGFPTAQAALDAARRIGFPVMLKAAAGGGGKGMRLCDDEKKFEAAFHGAQREAKSAFGDDTVYLEKAVVRPRHVEVQVFADTQGSVVHLFERDCSVQRRHQKVIEEAPSPVVTPELRARMGEVACTAARAVRYVGAGTCEFLVSQEGEFYFLEMNTRLQVEHAVTEMITGLDLVRWQIAVAEGQPLPLQQEQIQARGAAIECRIYAEDPVRFLPSPGRITSLRTPAGPFVRDDSGVYAGSEISIYYDPMISKLIVWADTRAEAIDRMGRALAEYRVGGIKTNLAFHRRVMKNREFQSGDYDTSFIERHKAELCVAGGDDAGVLDDALAAAAIHAVSELPPPVVATEEGGISAWRQRGWRG
ncbi:MAG: acetyl-CoA carboxylase biotin carboxylase subunit [Myxococcales bacterium]|nr:acetyl-CoA carboxylase biotin carboxylase subunit [Myxococcales bacterium]